MSKEVVQQVIQRIVQDPAFRQMMQEAPDQALVQYDLTVDERNQLLWNADEARAGSRSGNLSPLKTQRNY